MATYPSPTLQNLTVEGAATVTDTITASNFSGTSSGTNTGDQTITLTGDVAGSGTGSFATVLAAVGTAGTYGSATQIPVLTTDAKGRVTDVTLAAASTGSVTSVGLVDSTGLFTITGSPVTTSGDLTLSAFASQAGNLVLASPAGATGAPTFRALVAADIPSTIPTLAANNTFTGINTFSTNSTNILSAAFNEAGSTSNLIYDGGSNSIAIRSGASTAVKYWTLDALGNFNCLNGGLIATGTLKGSNFNTGIAPSTLTPGASPWTWQNTNAYGVFFYWVGSGGSGFAQKISADNSTFYTVNDTQDTTPIYVPSGWYLQTTYVTAPTTVTIVPV